MYFTWWERVLALGRLEIAKDENVMCNTCKNLINGIKIIPELPGNKLASLVSLWKS